jgi:hypothetical protein
MSDRLDGRIRAFVVELLDDPPEAPPFPRPDMVVVKSDRSDRREPVTDTQTKKPDTSRPRRWRGPLVALGAFVVVVAVAGAGLVALAMRDGSEPVADDVAVTGTEAVTSTEVVISSEDGAAALVGTTAEVVGGAAIGLPDSIEFGPDGTYRVVHGVTLDTGVYVTDGDSISFESDPTEEVLWVRKSSAAINPQPAHTCEGFVGEYQVVFQGGNRVTLEAVWDECPTRITIANGLELELLSD